jgi:hypothetical protein
VHGVDRFEIVYRKNLTEKHYCACVDARNEAEAMRIAWDVLSKTFGVGRIAVLAARKLAI